jgi:hypothetical protein
VPEGSNHAPEPELVKPDPEPELPPVQPPATKAPIQFNQQVNFYQQIPSSAWDRLSPEQILDLSKAIIQHIDVSDQRQFDWAKTQAASADAGKRAAIVWGSAITLAGFMATVYMGLHGHELIALTISLPLSTILAIIVGNRFLG